MNFVLPSIDLLGNTLIPIEILYFGVLRKQVVGFATHEKHRIPFSGKLLNSLNIEVIKVIVTDEDHMNLRELIEGTWSWSIAFGADEAERRSSITKDRVQ